MAGAWIEQIFRAASANNGNVVRRSKDSIRRYASMAVLLREVRARGFHMVDTGNQVVILCNTGAMRVHC